MSEDAEEDPRDQALERLTDTFSRLEALYTATQNPVYVWQAIAAQSFLLKYPQRFGGEPFNLLTPPWVAEYLVSSAARLATLTAGYMVTDHMELSARTAPGRIGNAPRYSLDTVDPAKLSDKVSTLLGFTVNGGNAFKRYRSTRRDLDISRRVQEMRAAGFSRQQAIARYMEESKEIDFSVLEKRLARGDRLLKQVELAHPKRRPRKSVTTRKTSP